ncbi:FecR domain-containing protein [Agriterribacter sp.]|uniref:FecR family protein n=1 Tax=Agriterribacter sp. TaxID=2821509 RepID=UPI002B79E89B|nr:FecR domain-containing protein [Agriterribacter sp.]HRO44420.1 FecR domain-containing protein [Agriterribacter sp.]HRQ18986.1 FecR domain-containing protein [Agriterribacter sp.]
MSYNKIWQLVARKLSGEASLDELKELEHLLQEYPEIAYKVDIYCQYFDNPSSQVYRTDEAKRRSLEQFRLQFNREFNNESEAVPLPLTYNSGAAMHGIKKWMAVAAGLITIAATVFFMTGREKGNAGIAQHKINEVNTMPGTRSKTVLPDGTIVWLNSDSRISYNADFGKNEREVTLTGEAFFDVAHNESVPMIVHAKTVSILVKGTAFNVRSYPGSDKVQTSLLRGSIELTTKDRPEQKILLKPNEKITIDVQENRPAANNDIPAPSAGTYNGNKKIYHIDSLKQSTLADVIPEVSWIENRLVFDNEPFTDVIDRMEKWYNVDIILTNQHLGGKNFSGVFEKENIAEALSALQIINYFDFEIMGRNVIIK